MKKIDLFFRNIVDRYLFGISAFLIIIISIVIRIQLSPVCVLSADYNNFIVPWVEQYREYGVFIGLSQTIGDYYVPYNVLLAIISIFPFEPYVLVSLVSCIFEYIMGYYIYKIVAVISSKGFTRQIIQRDAFFIAAIIMFLPHVIMNGSLWKQCDAIYAAFIVGCIYYVLKEKYNIAFVLASIGFCFKLQAIFIVPFLIIIYIIDKRISIFYFFWFPIMYIITGLPAVICGRPWKQVYKVYLKQAQGYDGMSINAPNIYALGLNDYPALHKVAILITVALFIGATCWLYNNKIGINKKQLAYVAAWVLYSCYMFLPAMHERYDYAAIVMVTVVLLIARSKAIWISIVMVFCSIVTYSSCILWGSSISLQYIAIPYVIGYIWFTLETRKSIINS